MKDTTLCRVCSAPAVHVDVSIALDGTREVCSYCEKHVPKPALPSNYCVTRHNLKALESLLLEARRTKRPPPTIDILTSFPLFDDKEYEKLERFPERQIGFLEKTVESIASFLLVIERTEKHNRDS